MKALIQKVTLQPKYTKIYSWAKLVTITGGVQSAVQFFGLLTGILIIRLLPTKEYAYYTLANAMLGTMTLLADGGISAGVMAQGSKVWQDKEKLGVVISTGLYLRRRFAIFSLLVSAPVLMYLLLFHGASVTSTILITLSLIPAFYSALSDSLLEVIPKLQQNIIALQKNQFSVSIGRLILGCISVFLFPFTFVAILSNGFPRMYGNFRLKKIVGLSADVNQEPSKEVTKEILKLVKRILPGMIYFSISGQVMIWLVSIFGSTEALAQVGALTRLSMILGIFSTVFITLVVPRFAKLPFDRNLLLGRYFQIFLSCSLVSAAIILLTYLFPHQVLWILGKNYSNLTEQVFFIVLISCINFTTAIISQLYTSKGWTIGPFVYIPLSLSSVLIGIYIFKADSLMAILKMDLFISVFQFFMHNIFCVKKIYFSSNSLT